MKSFIFPLCYVLAFGFFAPYNAYSKKPHSNRSQSTRQATPEPTAQPIPTATPQLNIQGTIMNLGAGFITVSAGQSPRTFKVTQYTQIVLDAHTATFANLKAGMLITLTPTTDQTYANSIVASSLAGTPPATN